MQAHVTSDVTGAGPGDATSDVTWMSYAELGRARGISASSAKRLAIRRHWRRQQGNDGTARVAVPVTEAVLREPRPGDDTRDVTPLPDIAAGALAALETAVMTLREQLDTANARADRAEVSIAGERQRADVLRDRIDAMQTEIAAAKAAAEQGRAGAQAAQDAAEALRRADAERKARGLVARLRAAWRGE